MKENNLKLSKQDLEKFVDSGSFINQDELIKKIELNNKHGKEKAGAIGEIIVRHVNRLSQNVFVQSMMKGFMMVIPLLVVGGLSTLIQTVPENLVTAFGTNKNWRLPIWLHQICTEVFNYTYGLAGILSCVAITYEMTVHLNKDLTTNKKIYPFVTIIAAVSCYMIFTLGQNIYELHVIPDKYIKDGGLYIPSGTAFNFKTNGGVAFGYVSLDALGPKGMLPSLIIAFSVPFIYKWCFKNNFTIRLPKFVPFAVSLTVMVLIPILLSIVIFVIPAFIILHFTGQGAFDWVNGKLSNLYNVSNTLPFYCGYQILCALCYFMGVHNAIISNIFESVRQVNVTENAKIMQEFINGLSKTPPMNCYVAATATNMIGGLGCLAMVPYSILCFAKSKRMKGLFVLTAVACFFNLPEPILFGLPVILNPVLFLPMLLAPIANSILMYGFIHWGPNMYAPYVDVAWCLPWIFVLPVATGVQPISFLCMFLTLCVSFVVWSPFIIIQDRLILRKEIEDGLSSRDSIENMSGFEILLMSMRDRKKYEDYKVMKNNLKIANKNKIIEEENIEYIKYLKERQAKSKYSLENIRTNLNQNNILIIGSLKDKNDEAKKLALSIINGLDSDPNRVLFVRTGICEKLGKTRKLVKVAQLTIVLQSAREYYEEYELISDKMNHIIIPISYEECTEYTNNSPKAIKLVADHTIQSNLIK
ncbi:PTS transporter subunit EIIC [Spiroplasma endosymbiont of Aspidapion aeneum]|uniref:PTS transporter subunit EIIC n=1 Tax=Spiroplasma endosymbiont of Aspidapion aeneum TaxID=3066276 RepID=UPI00313ADA29